MERAGKPGPQKSRTAVNFEVDEKKLKKLKKKVKDQKCPKWSAERSSKP